jgi:hypothetical protein
MLSDSRMKLPDFYNEEGQLNKSALRAYAEKRARAQVNAVPENIEKASAWGGIKEGYVGGEDGRINTPQELEFIRSLDEDTRAGFVEAYINELVNDYISLVPSNVKEKKKDDKTYSSLVSYDVELPTSDPNKPQTVEFQAFGKPLSGSVKNIIGFGTNQLGEFLVQVVKDVEVIGNKGEKTKEKQRSIRKATPDEIAIIKNILKKDYGVSLSENSVSSQEESNSGGMSDAEYQQWLKDNGLDG